MGTMEHDYLNFRGCLSHSSTGIFIYETVIERLLELQQLIGVIQNSACYVASTTHIK